MVAKNRCCGAILVILVVVVTDATAAAVLRFRVGMTSLLVFTAYSDPMFAWTPVVVVVKGASTARAAVEAYNW